ncbi:hypothetical protein, partial [Lactobacillus crispatus]|uniref:hypothetical protein n=1 Tax=Lactobacillus crispatus TaxID=47770 RepID=UPI00197B65B8
EQILSKKVAEGPIFIVKNFKENKKTIKILKKGNLDRFYSSGSYFFPRHLGTKTYSLILSLNFRQ